METEATSESTITTLRREILVGDKRIPVAVSTPDTPTAWGVVFTHGAGGDMDTPQVQGICEGLAGRGLLVLRFTCKGLNLKYRTWVYSEVLNYLQKSFPGIKQCFLGGRSMGSRAAVEVANQLAGTELEAFVGGVICVSYPLYPARSPDRIRDGPLHDLVYPALFVSGDQDEMCSKLDLEQVIHGASDWSSANQSQRGHSHKSIPQSTQHKSKHIYQTICRDSGGSTPNQSANGQAGKTENDLSQRRRRDRSVVWLEGAGHRLTTKSGGVDSTVRFVVQTVHSWIQSLDCKLTSPELSKTSTKAETKPSYTGSSKILGKAEGECSHTGPSKTSARVERKPYAGPSKTSGKTEAKPSYTGQSKTSTRVVAKPSYNGGSKMSRRVEGKPLYTGPSKTSGKFEQKPLYKRPIKTCGGPKRESGSPEPSDTSGRNRISNKRKASQETCLHRNVAKRRKGK